MRKVTATQLNAAYAAFLVDAETSGFWETTSAYVHYVTYALPSNLRADFAQDVLVEIFRCLARLQEGSDYAKWVNAVIKNMRADAFKKHYREKEVIVTGTELPEYDDEPLVPEDEKAIRHQLDEMHATLSPSASITFDLLRQGKSLVEVARIREMPYITIWQQFRRMKAKFQRTLVPQPV